MRKRMVKRVLMAQWDFLSRRRHTQRMMEEQQCLEQISSSLLEALGPPAAVAVILGSGWKDRASDLLTDSQEVPLTQFPDWPQPRVEGHGGELRCGQCANKKVILCGGRVHSYEGYEAREIVRGVRALVHWGVPNILLLNAAGSLRMEFTPGTLMALADHLNLGLPNPLRGDQSVDGSSTFLNLVDLYHPDWRRTLRGACPDVREGIYAGLPGPNYETPAEVQMLRTFGADAVGMSTVPEALAAKAAGARVMALSMMTNYAAGIGGSRPSHAEVLETAAEYGASAAAVLVAAIQAAPR